MTDADVTVECARQSTGPTGLRVGKSVDESGALAPRGVCLATVLG